MSAPEGGGVGEVAGVLAEAFDEWLFRMHGVTSSCDHRIEAEAMAEALAPLIAERERRAAEVALRDAQQALAGEDTVEWARSAHGPRISLAYAMTLLDDLLEEATCSE